jgi:DNA-binding response OmpR family regulator
VRVLIIEDEKRLAGFLRRALREDGHVVKVSHDGEEGAHLALHEDYDVILLDLGLPGRDGLSILRELRSRGKETPVLVLSGRDSVKDRVLGLDEGADDYLVKPAALDEVRARVRALLRRGKGAPATTLEFSDLRVDLVQQRVGRAGRAIALTPKEFSLLEFFLRNPNRVLTRTSIAEHVWDYDFDWESNIIDVFVNLLRKKLEEGKEPRLIHTVRGVGYVLREGSDPVSP